MPKETRWHQKVKEALKKLGEEKGYDVSESEQEILLASRFKRFSNEKREIHALSYRPDVVWKKRHIYRAIFEVEYLNPRSKMHLMDKRKYAIGSLMLASLARMQKSVECLVFITNDEALCGEIAKFVQSASIEHLDNTYYLCSSYTAESSLTKFLRARLMQKWKI